MLFLRQSTASQEILLGPFVDETDGKTAETGLTIANTDINIWKEGGTTESTKNSGGATHIAGGRYYAVLDATDTNTVGKMEINIHVSGALPVRREYHVLEPTIYDALIASGAGSTNRLPVSYDGALSATESYASDGSIPTLAQILFMLWSRLSQFDITDTTLTSNKLDGTTPAMTFDIGLDGNGKPRSATRTG